MPRKVKVDLSELESAFNNASEFDNRYFLDLETGQVVMLTFDTRAQLESLYEELDWEDGNQNPPLAELLQERNLPEWQKQALLEADQVEIGYGDRYIAVPQADSREAYRDMEAFIETVKDTDLQSRLWQAISGRGAFHYFRDVLDDFPREKQRWYTFRDNRIRQRVLDWLESEDIEPVVEPTGEEK